VGSRGDHTERVSLLRKPRRENGQISLIASGCEVDILCKESATCKFGTEKVTCQGQGSEQLDVKHGEALGAQKSGDSSQGKVGLWQ